MKARERKTPVPSLFDVLKEQTAYLFQQETFKTDLQYSVIDKECYEKILEGKEYGRELSGQEKESESVGAVLRASRVLVSK